MAKFNKTITTSVVEYGKTIAITVLVVAIAAFILGVQYQKRATVTVQNSVIVQAEAPVAEAKK
jgi:hypothetical protein